jgi:hypothetical protein
MTAPAFGRLLYTDCAPGTGRGSGGGFQIQAQSPGVDPQQASFAVSWLLYEAQNAWVADRRPVEDFPLGFAHSGAEGYGTAQGRYVGKEAVGGRMGNHLADCLLTRDPELFGTIRPAQLWQAPLWREQPWQTRDCPDFDGDLELGPLGLEDVTDWVRERAERGPALARLLSVLEDPKGQRVVIVTADAGEAMRWIAAATLLLPQRRALEVSFKVFSGGPLRSLQRVVAAPPDIFPDLRPGAGLGVFVLDAAACRTDDASVSERAGFLVGKFAGEADPYDVVDAADLALELSAGAWPQDIAAVLAAWALTRPGDPVSDPVALFRWLEQAGGAQLRGHGPAVTETLLAGDPPADVLRWLDNRMTARELEFDREVIRMRLLDAEISDALVGRASPGGMLSDASLSVQARRDAESALTSALLRGADGRVDEAEADRLLRLARRHGISLEPPSPPVEQFAKDFAWAWLSSSTPRDPDGWALQGLIISAARAELRARYTDDPSSAVVRDTIRRFMPHLRAAIGPDDPLYWPLQAAGMKDLPGEKKIAHLRKLLDYTSRLRRADPNQGYRAEKDLQQALLDWGVVNESVAVAVLTEVSGSQVNPEIDRYARGWLTDQLRKPNRELLTVLENLGDRVPAAPSGLAELAAGNKKVTQFIRAVTSGKISQPNTRSRAISNICDASIVVLKLRAAEVIDVLSDAELAGDVLATFPHHRDKNASPVPVLIAAIGKRFRELTTFEDQVDWAIWTLRIYLHPSLSSTRQGWLGEELSKFPRAVNAAGGTKNADKWRAEVRERLGRDDLRDEWDALFPKHGISWSFRG